MSENRLLILHSGKLASKLILRYSQTCRITLKTYARSDKFQN